MQIYIGEECDVTCKGGSIMGFCKSWRSLPIRSWSGGIKMADMPGTQPPRAVQSTLSALLAPEVTLEICMSLICRNWADCSPRGAAESVPNNSKCGHICTVQPAERLLHELFVRWEFLLKREHPWQDPGWAYAWCISLQSNCRMNCLFVE